MTKELLNDTLTLEWTCPLCDKIIQTHMKAYNKAYDRDLLYEEMQGLIGEHMDEINGGIMESES